MPAHERRLIVCHFCHEHAGHMVRYAVRFWAHWHCKLGPLSLEERKDFLTTLHPWTLQHAPAGVLSELGLLEFTAELLRQCKKRAV